VVIPIREFWSPMSARGHSRRFCGAHEESGLAPTPDVLPHRGESTLRANPHLSIGCPIITSGLAELLALE
jgi:hypothetical protein